MDPSSARGAALLAARARDSLDKRQRAMTALHSLEMAGEMITFPAVARAAGVSTWLVYAKGVREHIEAARGRQALKPTMATPASSAGLRADLALARAEVTRLRAEREKLAYRLRLQLGAEIEGPQRAELVARIADLEGANRHLLAERDARTSEASTALHRVRELEDELIAAQEGLRRMIRAENIGH